MVVITIVQIKILIIILRKEGIIVTNQETHLVEIGHKISKKMIESSTVNSVVLMNWNISLTKIDQ
jgi:hypothetical protein